MDNEENAPSSSIQETTKNTEDQGLNKDIDALYNDLVKNKKVDRVVILECVYLSFKILKKYNKKSKEEKMNITKMVVNKIIEKSDLTDKEKRNSIELVDILIEPAYNVVYRAQPWFKRVFKKLFH